MGDSEHVAAGRSQRRRLSWAALIAALIGCSANGARTGDGDAPDAPPGAPATAMLTVARAGTAAGTVTSSVGGISCGTACSAALPIGTAVTLTAAADPGAMFAGWSGAGCAGTTETCTVSLQTATTVTATFAAPPQVYLRVTTAGTGAGTVTSPAVGLNCVSIGICVVAVDAGTRVELTATPDRGSSFTGWSSPDCPGTDRCTLTVSANTDLTATFTYIRYPLTVALSGAGTVTSSPLGIRCGSTCSAMFGNGGTVTLSAVPDTGWTFTGWSGAGCTGTDTCAVTMTGAASVTANFAAGTFPLTVVTPGAGSGVVMSSPAGIVCGSTCSAGFLAGTMVTLDAAPQPGSTFAGWSGAGCAGTGSCTVTVTAAATVTALFAPITASLSVQRTGTGTGTVTSSPGAIDCGTTCGDSFALGTLVTLTATPAPGSTFDGWTGACAGTDPCIVTIDGAKLVGATFTLVVYTLDVAATNNIGFGMALVKSADGAIDCSQAYWGHNKCQAIYPAGTAVTLTLIPDGDYSFWEWRGACAGQGPVCQLTMSSNLSTTGAEKCGQLCI